MNTIQRLSRSFAGLAFVGLLIPMGSCAPEPVTTADVETLDEVVYRLDSEEPFTGTVLETFADSIPSDVGVYASETAYQDGIREGVRREWHPNGALARTQTYVAGSTQGTVEDFDSEGRLVRTQEVVDGRAEGTTRTYHPNGALASEESYLAGALHGRLAFWYPDGTPKAERHYRNGHPHGSALEWFEDGARKIEGEYSLGRVHGPYRRWHPDGRLALEGQYHRGRSFELRMWDSAGVALPVEPEITLADTAANPRDAQPSTSPHGR